MARQHNDANAIAFGQRLTDPLQAEYYLKTFLETPYEGGRHQGRVEKIDAKS
ncbi:MAG TPA: RpiB/LacA/LacB family sugar-phosphate isomerase [Holophaga sp.]|nr:RpiB/LacA/LacB family sugar-phosphate isomerase [Holophaga sp.]